MPDQIQNVKADPEGPAGRTMGKWLRKDGQTVVVLLEWTSTARKTVVTYLANVEERIPTGGIRSEEIHTLKIIGLFSEGPRTALVYQCFQQPTDLRDVLLTVGKPSGDDRRALSRIIATQVRSLHVHFQLHHTALRAQSFVFFGNGNGNAKRPDLTKPYVLDWVHTSGPNMYQHPEYQVDKPLWFDQVWSLMMVLSEIAEWRPLDETSQDEKKLLEKKGERMRLVTSPDWKGAPTSKIFKHGFGLFEKDRRTLEQYGHWRVKRFYDELCELLASSPPY